MGLSLVVVAALAACASPGEDALATSTTAGKESPTTSEHSAKPSVADPDVPCQPDDLDPAALEPLMLDEREGFTKQPDDAADTGPSDLAKATRDDEQNDASSVLRDVGFRRGYQRYWTNQADNELVGFAYEFCDEHGAATYADRVLNAVNDGLEPFEVVGHPGMRGLSGTRAGYVTAYAFEVQDGWLIFTVAQGPDGTLLRREAQQRATALVADQLDELTTS